MEKAKILLVEDDELASELIYNFLEEGDFDVLPVFSATDAISYVRNEAFEIVLLDINLPDYNGYEVLKSLREYSPIPVIVTSAYSDTKSKLLAFNYGANDYMTKPLDLEELEARIWLQMKKNSRIGKVEEASPFDRRAGTIYFQKEPLDLTTIEYDIFSFLLERKNQTVRREELMELVSTAANGRSLDNHIKNIRRKIGDSGSNAQYLKTVYGVGYILRA